MRKAYRPLAPPAGGDAVPPEDEALAKAVLRHVRGSFDRVTAAPAFVVTEEGGTAYAGMGFTAVRRGYTCAILLSHALLLHLVQQPAGRRPGWPWSTLEFSLDEAEVPAAQRERVRWCPPNGSAPLREVERRFAEPLVASYGGSLLAVPARGRTN